MTRSAVRPVDMRYITRREDLYFQGWQVRIGQRSGKEVSKFFGDGRYGGKEKALKAAKRFRDKALKTIFRSDGSRPLSHGKPNVNTKHGLPQGVRLDVRFAKHKGKVYKCESFYAYWIDPETKERSTKSYAIIKHGYKEAKRLAIAWRKAHEAMNG